MTGIEACFRLNRGGFTLDSEFQAPGNGVTALFGRSGCGKTTLLRCIAGLERVPGWCRINGEVWQSERRFLAPHRRAVGYVFQEASLFSHLSVRDNLKFGWRRVAPIDRRVSPEVVIDLLGIQPLLDRATAALSGGERQRVAIARALLASPRLLLMDEPLAALDHTAKQTILPRLERICDELGLPVIYVSHDPDEVARLANYMVVVEAGKVTAQGDAAEIMSRLDLFPARVNQATAVLEGTVAGHDETYNLTYISMDGGRFAIPRADIAEGKRARIQVHARDVSLSLSPHHDTTILNIVPVQVIDTLEADPARLLVRLRLQDGQRFIARITRRSGVALGLQEQQHLYAQVKSVALIDF